MKRTRKCTKCKVLTQWGTTGVEFERNGVRVTITGVVAMICPNCGETFLPGLEAAALTRAVEEIFRAIENAKPVGAKELVEHQG